MNIHLGNKFDSHFDETLKNKNEDFWNDVLNNFRNEKDYEKKLQFFKRYELNLQTEYKPQIPFYFDSTELNLTLVTYDNMLLQEGINEVNPNDEFLIQWYLKQNVNNTNQLSTIESRNFVLFQHRFKLKVMPEGYFDSDEKRLFNKYLEEQITKYYPEVIAANMFKTFLSKKVLDRKNQMDEVLNQIQKKVQLYTISLTNRIQERGALKAAEQIVNLRNFDSSNHEGYHYDEREFLEGYSKCKSDGIDYVPTNNKITYDFIVGKNTAIFEYMLPQMLNKEFEEVSKEEKTNKETLTHKQQILLLKELGILRNPILLKLTEKQKGELIGSLLNKNFKNTEDYIRYSGGVNAGLKFKLDTQTNIEKVDKLLTKVGIKIKK